ncbi:MAG: hypothetical protein JKY93_03320 [Gammaproteobacteria bacterium]|nr:hypothetical protein [Gammaproteobacteria bacterium]
MILIDPNGQGITPSVTFEEFTRATHVDGDDDRLSIEAYLLAAQGIVETGTRRPLTRRTMRFEFEIHRAGEFQAWFFPIAPVSEVLKVSAWSMDDGDVEIAPGEYALVRGFDEPKLCFSWSAMSDLSGAGLGKVEAEIGYDDSYNSGELKQAIILIAKEWYDQDVSIGEAEEFRLSFGSKSIIKQKRYYRPCEFG